MGFEIRNYVLKRVGSTQWSVKITPDIRQQSYFLLLLLRSSRSGTAYCLLLHWRGCCAQPSVLLEVRRLRATTDELLGLSVVRSVYQNHYFGPVVNQSQKVCWFYSVQIYTYIYIYICVCVCVCVCVSACVYFVCDIHNTCKCIRKEVAFLLQ
jgi:hypothetical protein